MRGLALLCLALLAGLCLGRGGKGDRRREGMGRSMSRGGHGHSHGGYGGYDSDRSMSRSHGPGWRERYGDGDVFESDMDADFGEWESGMEEEWEEPAYPPRRRPSWGRRGRWPSRRRGGGRRGRSHRRRRPCGGRGGSSSSSSSSSSSEDSDEKEGGYKKGHGYGGKYGGNHEMAWAGLDMLCGNGTAGDRMRIMMSAMGGASEGLSYSPLTQCFKDAHNMFKEKCLPQMMMAPPAYKHCAHEDPVGKHLIKSYMGLSHAWHMSLKQCGMAAAGLAGINFGGKPGRRRQKRQASEGMAKMAAGMMAEVGDMAPGDMPPLSSRLAPGGFPQMISNADYAANMETCYKEVQTKMDECLGMVGECPALETCLAESQGLRDVKKSLEGQLKTSMDACVKAQPQMDDSWAVAT